MHKKPRTGPEVKEALKNEWHKLLAITLHKLGLTHVTITEDDVHRFMLSKYPHEAVIIAHDRKDGLHILLTTNKEAEQMIRQLEGRDTPTQN